MNSNILENLYSQCMAVGFRAIGHEPVPITDTAGFTLAREENTTLCLVQITDLCRLDKSICLFLQDQEMERANSLAAMYSTVWIVFLSVGKGSPDISRAEGYFGQSPYAVYWHINPETGEFFVPPNQPDDVMGLKTAVKAVLAADGHDATDALFPEDALGDTASAEFGNTTGDGTASSGTMGSGTAGSDTAGKHGVFRPGNNADEEPDSVRVRFPFCTIILMTTNILMMVLMFQQGYADTPELVAARFGAIIPVLILEAGEYHRLLTAMFVHFGWVHLFFNVTGILIFGTRIERHYGKLSFLAVYFISGLSASVASLFFTRGFSAGASGAVYGLLGAAFVYTRYTKKSMDIIDNHVILVYIIAGLSMGFVMPNIDYFGHIGGLLAGLIVGYGILKFGKN